jgi:hypothetical protein
MPVHYYGTEKSNHLQIHGQQKTDLEVKKKTTLETARP